MKLRSIVPALTAATMMTALLPGSAKAWVQAGTLDCRSAGGATFVVGAVLQFRCMFFPAYGGRPHRYYATIQRLGATPGPEWRTRRVSIPLGRVDACPAANPTL